MWHASFQSGPMHDKPTEKIRQYLVKMMQPYGDVEAGQWFDDRVTPSDRPLVHLRRRLNRVEEKALDALPNIPGVRDIRGTVEARDRIAEIARVTGLPFEQLERLG